MTENQKDNSLEIKEIIAPYLRYWYIYAICAILAVVGVKLYTRYIVPEYSTYATVLIKTGNNNGGQGGALSAIQEVNGMRSEGIDNELLSLRSKRLLKKVIENLNLYTTLTRKGKVLETEVYGKESPLKIIVQPKDSIARFSENFALTYDDKNVYLTQGGKVGKYAYDLPIIFDFGSITFKKKSAKIGTGEMQMNISDAQTVTDRLRGRIDANRFQNYQSAIILSMTNSEPEKAKDIILNLIEVFNEDAVDDKNMEARKTAAFVNERIKIINDELGGVEGEIENFKEDNQIVDPISGASESLTEMKALSKELLDLNTKEEFTNIYKNQIRNAPIDEILPSNILSQNAELSSYVSEYNKIVIERNVQKQAGTDLNPVIKGKTEQLHQLKDAIISSIQKEANLLKTQKDLINNKLKKYQTAFNRFPAQERILRSINRQQSIKENLYLLLLQKREENAIALATSADKAKLIDAPESSGPINLNFSTYYLGALLLGLLIPIGLVYLSTLLDTKIKGRKELSRLVGDYPILGELPSLKKEEANDVVTEDLSSLAESFRVLRTNLQFMLGASTNNEGKTILVTSTIKGEGKTFVSINLAHILSQLKDKKTVIIGADIRNPQLQRYFHGSRKNIGLTEYLYDKNVSIGDILIKSSYDNKTAMILSGAIPPNPTELIMSERLGELIQDLKQEFDFIIIDSAPLLLVSDTYHISHYADVCMIVVRSGFTDKQLLEHPLKAVEDHKIKHASFVLNDVNSRNSGYGYGYNYGYGYGYHSKKKKSWYKKLLSKITKK
ncbi:polysaccharide biosynthesis tyrosine autokinase [Ornithobacterium rhinotracheale]|uniref:non-specific protein-tyrosine kinase n=1 Tax=Ornithobacterium rhinotracheale TaxID=28251 RepID=A0A410JP65_ORNRH|nr:polysaccharide biosynthesis tyrosine autokinase [Ornithobacterium rhinotracheale]QAR29929.1 polysaccharide biosynthesis tyrosine autokinase [Ornithobacterium rhinotracheale]